jgi:hypothetical protein
MAKTPYESVKKNFLKWFLDYGIIANPNTVARHIKPLSSFELLKLRTISDALREHVEEEQKRRTETLIRLAELAVPQNEDWGSERQINAEINWVETASKNMTSERVEEWNTYALKATTEEAVNYGLKLLGINYTV